MIRIYYWFVIIVGILNLLFGFMSIYTKETNMALLQFTIAIFSIGTINATCKNMSDIHKMLKE